MYTKKLIMSALLSFAIASCSSQMPINNDIKTSSGIKLSNVETSIVSLSYSPKVSSFGIKGVNFSNPMITQLKLDVMGQGMTTVSQTVNYTVGQTATFNISVPVGTNRIVSLYALDKNNSVISTLHGAVNVVANQTNNAKISFFETVVGQVLTNILNGSNPSVLNNVNLTNLRASLVTLTGYDEVANQFTKIDPAKVDVVSIANYMSANNGSFPPDTFTTTQGVGSVTVNGNQSGLTIMVNDLNSSTIQSTTLNSTSVQNVSPGMWKITVMKNGFLPMTQDVKVTAGQNTDISAMLVGSKMFTADLNGGQEVPAVTTTSMGKATIMLNDDNTAMVTVKITAPLTGGVATGAHIHGPAAVGVNAPILINLPLGSFSGAKITLTQTQVDQLRAGQFYINIHNATFPSGEIRGQLNSSATMPVAFNKMVYGVDTANMLVTFMSSTPNTVTKRAITGLQTGETVVGLDVRPLDNTLVALGSSSRIYTIAESTGVATVIGGGTFTPALGSSGLNYGFDFNPTVDRIRVHSNIDENLRLNPNSIAAGLTDTVIAYATGDVNAAANPNLVATAYSNSLPNAQTTALYAIDSNLDILTNLASPNNGLVSTVGALGVNTTANAGFDIDPDTGMAFAALSTSDTNSGLYSVNLTNGTVTLLGAINTTTPITSIAMKQNP